jgi:hypothetical protein
MNVLWLLLLPMAIILAARLVWPQQISIKEAIVVGLACAVIVAGAFFGTIWYNRADTEIRNGHVTSKERVSVPCSHCQQVCTGSGDNKSCRTVCDHFRDYDWVVRTTVGELTIARVDRQGTKMPPRFNAVVIGEPASLEHRYQNYILGAANSIFRPTENDAAWAGRIPGYPRVNDYYRINRVLTLDVAWPHSKEFNAQLNTMLAKLGPRKQVNLVVVVTKRPQEFTFALENSWVGGKKNDVVIVYGVEDDLSIKYVRAFTFANSSGNESFVVSLRDQLVALKDLADLESHVTAIEATVQAEFRRKEMSDFKYLAAESEPGVVTVLLIALLGLIAVAIGLYIAYHHRCSSESYFPNRRFR